MVAYPQIIRLLMDRTYRRDMLKKCPAQVTERSLLADLDREYTLNEIAIITRAGPARILGLTNKGHLGVGADADVTIYTPDENKETMFELPRYVIKGGRTIVDDAQVQPPISGKTLHVAPEFDEERESRIAEWFNQHYTIRFNNYAVDEQYLAANETVACEPNL